MSFGQRAAGTARQVGALIAATAAPVGLFLVLHSAPGLDAYFQSLSFHLVVVSATAACALLVAVLAGIAATRARNGDIVLLALGCLAIGIFMLAHGLTTPGIAGQPPNVWVARVPLLAIIIFTTCVAAAVCVDDNSRWSQLVARAPRLSLAAPAAMMGALGLVVVLRPTSLAGTMFVPGEQVISRVLGGIVGVILIGVAGVHWRRWHLGRDPVQRALALATWLGALAVLSLQLGRLWRVSWWDYHAFLLAGFALTAWAVIHEYRRAPQTATALGRVYVTDPFEHIVGGYTESLRPLVAAVEAKDNYTHGHSLRVAELAVRLGERLGLGADTLRALAEGAYLHDIGKIGVPDAVLNKPGELTDDERRIIEAHPVVGYEIVGRATSLRHALPAIHHHHERWDGHGYPDGIHDHEIPQIARVVAVADVWDALTTERAYRTAWSPTAALDYLLRSAGEHLDPECVHGFEAVAHELGLVSDDPPPTGMDLPTPGEVCHHRLVIARRQAHI